MALVNFLHVRIINPWHWAYGKVFGVEKREYRRDGAILYHVILPGEMDSRNWFAEADVEPI